MKRSLYIMFTLVFVACSVEDIIPTDDVDQQLGDLLKRYGGIEKFIIPASTDFQNIPQDPKNPLTEEKIYLGKRLFHETGIAVDPRISSSQGTYSCASCHHAAAGFQAGLKQGIGEGGTGFGRSGEARVPMNNFPFDSLDVQPIRSPSILNTAFQEVMLWNGQFGATGVNESTFPVWATGTPLETNFLGYQGLEIQAIAGLEVHRLDVVKEFLEVNAYKDLFEKAFPNLPESQMYSKEYAGLAIAAYERTVLANEAPFQKWLRGDKAAMNEQELKGAMLFFGKAACVSCHNTPGLSGNSFNAIGMADLEGPGIYGTQTEDADNARLGRAGFTKLDKDNYKFKVPQLYNLKDVSFFGHGGTFSSIKEVIQYKNEAKVQNPAVTQEFLDETFVPLFLTDEEIDQLSAFIENALYDPSLSRYVPNSLPTGSCFPNADGQSVIDLGCN